MTLFLLCLLICCMQDAVPQRISHYVYFNLDRERIRSESFLNAEGLVGAQLKYTWRELEPAKGVYDFDALEQDLNFLTRHGKKLFVQLQDVTFDTSRVNVPDYLLKDPEYNGGADLQFEIDEKGQIVPEGWVARRWDVKVRERFFALLKALGDRFDGKIEGINLPETALDFGDDPAKFPEGFTTDAYRDAVIATMRALKKAFPTSVTIQYSNFMPGEWLLPDDESYLRDIYRAAVDLGVGLGGPDLLPWKKGQMDNGYRFIKMCRGKIPSGIAVQWGNYDYINPRTRNRVTLRELISFADEYLGVQYVFWSTQEPYYSRDVLPHFAVQKR